MADRISRPLSDIESIQSLRDGLKVGGQPRNRYFNRRFIELPGDAWLGLRLQGRRPLARLSGFDPEKRNFGLFWLPNYLFFLTVAF